jgi:lipid II:glycine glycyltransferase (peptidoglycan interpeptide bridge formation enzyme)
MMQLREIDNKETWDGFLQSTKLPVSFFQSYTWGEFEKEQGQEVFRYGIYIDEKLRGLLQAVLVKAKRGTFLHIRNGPVFELSEITTYARLLNLLKIEAAKHNCDYIRLSPLISNTQKNLEKLDLLGLKLSQMHDVDAEITWVLDLSQKQEDILANMRKTTRYLIKQAEKNQDLKIEISDKVEDLEEFFKVYEDTVKRQKWHAYSFEYIKKEFEHFKKDDAIRIFLARYQGKVIAASLFIYYQDEVYYHHSGSLSEYRKIPAMYLLHWESIKYAKSKGFRIYNFFGIARDNDPKHPWAGLTLFKQGFGGEQREWVHARDLPLNKRYWLTHFFEKIERKRRGYK